MIIKCSLNNFRKNFNRNFQGFYLRIRNDSDDIAYYNGIKAFQVYKVDENTIGIKIPENVYNLNVTNVRNAKNKGIDIVSIIGNLKNKYFNKELIAIKINKGPLSYDKNNHDKTITAFNNIKDSLGENIKYFEDELSDELIEKILNSFDSGESSYKIDVTSYNEDLKVESIFIENRGEKYGLSIPTFIYKEIKEEKTIELYELYNDTKNAIEKYEECTRIESEKKYQHQFTLGAYNNSMFNVYPFEEEYYIQEKINRDNDKNGRIDSIIYKRNNDILKDIYLIELKVDEGVVLKDNGVMTHLDDIKNLINKTDYNNIKDNDFFYLLKRRIEQRIQALENYSFKFKNDINKIDYKIHFYTIIGFTNEESKKEVISMLNKLKSKDEVNKLISKNDLIDTFKDKSIYDVVNQMNDKSKCEIKFFFDENYWYKTSDYFTPNYVDVTDTYFKGLNE